MVDCRAFLIECRALLTEYRALLIDISTVLAWGGVVNLGLYGAVRVVRFFSFDMKLF